MKTWMEKDTIKTIENDMGVVWGGIHQLTVVFLSSLGNIDVARHEVFALSARKLNKPAKRCKQEKNNKK